MSEEKDVDKTSSDEGRPDFRSEVESKVIPDKKEEAPPRVKVKQEVALGSPEAPTPTTKLDPDKNKYDGGKMYKKDEDHPPKGTITITVYPHKEYDCKFEGDSLTGSDINRAWRMMVRGYRLWKHSQSKTMKQVTEEAEAKAKAKQEAEVV